MPFAIALFLNQEREVLAVIVLVVHYVIENHAAEHLFHILLALGKITCKRQKVEIIENGVGKGNVEQVADKSGVAVSNITRFEQKGLISLKNLIGIAIALDYTSEIKNVFSQPKYSTMEELQQIKRNANKKKAYRQ